MTDLGIVHLLVALPCEAKPLVRHYGLTRLMDETVFPVYRADGRTLTVSGVGKAAMAAATAYTYGIFGKARDRAWLNVGVAGHGNAATGKVFLADKIEDFDREYSWYPPLVFESPCPTTALVTVSRPELNYPGNRLYDMEASGFVETAMRFSTSELVQCLKIVSDNRVSPAQQLSAERVADLIGQHIPTIDQLAGTLMEMALEINPDPDISVDEFRERWRFTSQQTVQLREILIRWKLLDASSVPIPGDLESLKNSRQVLDYLRQQVDRIPIEFP